MVFIVGVSMQIVWSLPNLLLNSSCLLGLWSIQALMSSAMSSVVFASSLSQ